MFDNIKRDVNAVMDRDPAARNKVEVLLLYPGVHAMIMHRQAHWLHTHHLKYLARLLSQLNRFFTGIEIHPGAKIGKGFFIDHGMGVVIGETAVVGDNCTIYHGVTLGGTGKNKEKRHPTLGNNVMVGCGAKILGPFTVGDNSKIAANAVVLKEVPPGSTCVGIPAKIVETKRTSGDIPASMDLEHGRIKDPVDLEFEELIEQVEALQKELDQIKTRCNKNGGFAE